MRLADQILDVGFAFLPKFKTEKSVNEAMSSLGSLVSLGKGEPVHLLQPKPSLNEPPNTYSGNYGHGQFPFHSDLAHHRHPPKYLILRCIKGHPSVTTPLIDSRVIMDRVGEQELTRALVRSRRRVRGEATLMRLCETTTSGVRFRWDELFLVPASELGKQAFQMVKAEIKRQRAIDLSLANPGDTLVVDNWRMLHSRSSVPVSAVDRVVARAYLEKLY